MKMRKTHMIIAGTLALALAASASFADAKPTRHHSPSDARANAKTAELNRQQLQGTSLTNGAVDANGNSMTNSTGVDSTAQAPDSTGNINSAATTTDQNSVPAGSMSSTTNSAVAGEASPPPAGQPTTDSTVPDQGQSVSPSATNTQPKPSEDKGATGKNANPTDATDTPQ